MSEPRYFIKLTAPDRQRLLSPASSGMDLFSHTLTVGNKGEATIDGLLTIKEIEALVKAGLSVTVLEEDKKRFHSQRFIGFEQWRAEIEEELGKIRD